MAEVWDEKTKRVKTLTDEEYKEYIISECGEEVWKDLKAPNSTDPDVLRLTAKMTDQEKTNHVLSKTLADAGVDSIFDLPYEGDDEVLPAGDLEDFVPREYDHEAAWRKYGPGQDGGNSPGKA